MISKPSQEKGFLAKLLEKAIKILLTKECNKVDKIKIEIIANSIQILKGKIPKIKILAEGINYKDLLFDEIELEAKELKIFLKLNNIQLKLKDENKVNFKIMLSENSLKKILSSYDWIGAKICKEISNQDKLEDIKIHNNQLYIKTLKSNNLINQLENILLTSDNGKIYIKSISNNKSIKIPLEDKVYIQNISIKNNLIILFATSSISFD